MFEELKIKSLKNIDKFNLLIIKNMLPVLNKYNYLKNVDTIKLSEYTYLSSRVNEYRNFKKEDIDLVKMDYINGYKIEELCIKYFLSIDVITDILNNYYNSTSGIIESKLYSINNGVKQLKSRQVNKEDYKNIYHSDIGSKLIRIKQGNKTHYYIYGRDLLTVDSLLNNTYEASVNNEQYISLKEATLLIGGIKSSFKMFKNKISIFDTDIKTIIVKNNIMYSYEDCILANINKNKNYIEISEIKNYTRLANHLKNIVLDIFKFKYSKHNNNITLLHKNAAIELNNIALTVLDNDVDKISKLAIEYFEYFDKRKRVTVTQLVPIIGTRFKSVNELFSKVKNIFNVPINDDDIIKRSLSYKTVKAIIDNRVKYTYLLHKGIPSINNAWRGRIVKLYPGCFVSKYFILNTEYLNFKTNITALSLHPKDKRMNWTDFKLIKNTIDSD